MLVGLAVQHSLNVFHRQHDVDVELRHGLTGNRNPELVFQMRHARMSIELSITPVRFFGGKLALLFGIRRLLRERHSSHDIDRFFVAFVVVFLAPLCTPEPKERRSCKLVA